MGTFGRQIGGIATPSINEEKIIDFIRQTKFHELDSEQLKTTGFFSEFQEMYNGLPILSRYSCNDHETLRRCFTWLGFDVYKNGTPIESYSYNNDGDPMEYQFKSYKTNRIIHALLSNPSLVVKDIDGETGFTNFAEPYNDITTFSRIEFTEVNPFTFDGELAAIALEGSVYVKWKRAQFETKSLTLDFANVLMEGRFSDFKIYRTQECWSGYILGFFIAYFLFDTNKGEFWILSKDDFD
ncbi:hypothetical protein [Microcoleus sp. F10-A1]|uniref:hypothetical protein n=1 Tax=Microcoleus sp. F10-A1 TaxID=2818750 RepID=UPI002FD2421F